MLRLFVILRRIDAEERPQSRIKSHDRLDGEIVRFDVRQHARRLTNPMCESRLDIGKERSSVNRMGQLQDDAGSLATRARNRRNDGASCFTLLDHPPDEWHAQKRQITGDDQHVIVPCSAEARGDAAERSFAWVVVQCQRRVEIAISRSIGSDHKEIAGERTKPLDQMGDKRTAITMKRHERFVAS